MTGQPAARVLVVSDEPDAARFLGRVLEDAGFEIVTCPIEDIAIELASSFPSFDVVLGDGIDTDVLSRVRNLADPDRAATPVVNLASHINPDNTDDTGPSVSLIRPVGEQDLVEALTDMVTRRPDQPAESDSATGDDR